MKANYNVTGKDRKALVAAIAELTGDKAVYKYMPTCAYEIGDITVDKEGGVTCEDDDKLTRITQSLLADGFTAEMDEEVESTDEETTARTRMAPALRSACRLTRWRSETSRTCSPPKKASSKRRSALTTLASR